MKPVFSYIMLFMVCFTNAFGQETPGVLTEAEWEKLFPHLEKEEWGEADKLTFEYLKKFSKDNENSDEAGIIRYMYLCSVGGQLGNKEISKEEALEKVSGLKGKNFVTPACTFKREGMFNFFSYSEEEKKWNKCFANNDNTVIYLFEYYDMDNANASNKDFMERIEGKWLRLSGKIKDIKAEGYTMPRLRVEYSDVDIWDMPDE